MAEEHFTDTDIDVESKISYTAVEHFEVLHWLAKKIACGGAIFACHREDHHKDGSVSHHYYLELPYDDFLEMGGREVE
jgi:hypothetical protein